MEEGEEFGGGFAAPFGPGEQMSEIDYITMSEWATQCGVSTQRAHQVLNSRVVPGVKVFHRQKTNLYFIPSGTPWPDGLPSHCAPPGGFLTLKEWAKQNGKSKEAGYSMIHKHGAPKGSIRQNEWQYFIPKDAGWPYPSRGNPYGRRGRPGRANRG